MICGLIDRSRFQVEVDPSEQPTIILQMRPFKLFVSLILQSVDVVAASLRRIGADILITYEAASSDQDQRRRIRFFYFHPFVRDLHPSTLCFRQKTRLESDGAVLHLTSESELIFADRSRDPSLMRAAHRGREGYSTGFIRLDVDHDGLIRSAGEDLSSVVDISGPIAHGDQR